MKIKRRLFWIGALVGLIVIISLSAGPAMSKTEEPAYRVLQSDNSIEVRVYEPRIRATARVSGSMRQATSQGFSVLAEYIFGGNRSQDEIAMTAPVESVPVGQPIAMTAPVEAIPQDGEWVITFTMPSEWTMQTLPAPLRNDVVLEQVPQRTVATLRFSGRASHADFIQKEAELRAWLQSAGLQADGDAVYAQYDAPMTLPWNRRNEVMITLPETSA